MNHGFLYNRNMTKLLQMLQNDDSYFRAGAGVMILNGDDQVIMFERSDLIGEFQFSQGGLDEGEDPKIGAFRELYEETGISEDQITILGELPYWVSYDADITRGKTIDYRGQTQRWFYARLNEGIDIDLETAQDKEFISYKWVSLDQSLESIVAFKKPMYVQIISYLQEELL